MKAQFVAKIWRLLFIFIFAFGMVGMPASSVMAKEVIPLEIAQGHSNVSAGDHLPIIQVELPVYDRRISGRDWPLNHWITLTIEDPTTSQSPDLSASKQTEPCPWDGLYGCVNFTMGNVQYAIGQVVTMTDGVVTKSFIIGTLSLQIAGIDVFTDKAWGTADPGSQVDVNAGDAIQTVVTDSTGNWLVDFAPLGEDLSFTTYVSVVQHDEDGDQFFDLKSLNNFFGGSPTFGVVAYDPNNLHIHNIVHGNVWEPGRTINLKIDHPGNELDWDYEDTMVVPDGHLGCYWSQWCFQPDPHVYQIKPGDLVRVSDGTVVKETVVTSLKVTRYDTDLDVMEGFSNTNSFNLDQVIQIDAYAFTSTNERIDTDRYAILDAEGKWMTDFGRPGPFPEEQTTLDLQKKGFAILTQVDEDGDATQVWWSVLNPYIEASARDNWVRARNWPVGAEVALTINNEIFLPPVLVQPNPGNPESPEGSLAEFDLFEYDLQAGDIITAASTADTVTYVVAPIEVTNLDQENDTITGIASPQANVQICVNVPGDCIQHTVQADEAGVWTTIFHGELDLQSGSNGQAAVQDWNGNQTIYEWNIYIPNPNITIFPDDDLIEGNEWQTGAPVTIHVGDPAAPIYTATTEVAAPDAAHDRSWFSINLTGIVNLQPGQTVTATDGQITKQVKVAPRGITMLDPVSGTLTGVAEREIVNVVLWACADNSCGARRKDVDADGNWSVRFAVPGELGWENGIVDIQNRTSEGICLSDQDGDGTIYREWLSNRSPWAEAGPDQTTYAGQDVTFSAADSSDPDGDALQYEWDLDGDGQFDDASGILVTTSFPHPGEYHVGLRVSDGGGLSAMDTLSITVLQWTLKGFYHPVDMNGVYNVVKNGSTAPLKFEVFAGSTELTSMSAIKSLTYAPVVCDVHAITDEIETTVLTATGLRYDGSAGQFVYNWKTPGIAGMCYRVTLVTLDGTAILAYFKLK